MPAGERVVVDSSVFAAILLREPGHAALTSRLTALRSVRTAPFFRFEVANAIWKQKHWSDADAAVAIDVLFTLPVDEDFDAADARAAMDLAREHNHPFYDAAFIALARRHDQPLWTLDRRQAALAAACGVPAATN